MEIQMHTSVNTPAHGGGEEGSGYMGAAKQEDTNIHLTSPRIPLKHTLE